MIKLHPHAATMPVVGISANVRQLVDYRFHGSAEKILHTVFETAGCLPLILPALGPRYDFNDLIGRLDGLVLTGGNAHVDPSHYGGDLHVPDDKRDHDRDATVLPLIREALKAELPLLAVCRGMQELNVALGGSLQAAHEDHHHDHHAHVEEWLERDVHHITLNQDGMLARMMGVADLTVNSAHEQALGQLAPGLRVEATTDDGTIEAVSSTTAKFAVGVQWHPEYSRDDQAAQLQLFRAFGDAARARLALRHASA